jgi:DNA-binding PadR family transcriptional regulator
MATLAGVPRSDAALAEQVCLALLTEGPTHGWALSQLLAPGAEIGRVWTLSRPLTYRALEQLVADGLVVRAGREPGQGRVRTILRATPKGRRAARRWLDRPVAHLRDVRTELLVKLELRRRRGLPMRPLLEAQQAAFRPIIEGLAEAPVDAAVAAPVDVVALWRRESATTVARFLAAALAAEDVHTGSRPAVDGRRTR